MERKIRMNRPDLPVYYYHTHFVEMLDFVSATYRDILREDHWHFVKKFNALPHNAQCLYVRMANRKGYIFNSQNFQYDEIADINDALDNLRRSGFVRSLVARDFHDWINMFKKDALVSLASNLNIMTKSSWSKAKIVRVLVADTDFDGSIQVCSPDSYLVQSQTAPLDYFLFLYFGKINLDTKSFALRDLGLVRVNANQEFSSRFTNAEEAEDTFLYSQILSILKSKGIIDHMGIAQDLLHRAPSVYEPAKILRDKALFHSGRYFEQCANTELALQLYQQSNYPESRQRQVKLLYSIGQKEDAKALLETILDDPDSDDLYYFASDFYNRKYHGKRLSERTALLRESSAINIDEAYRDMPEEGVCQYFRHQGWKAIHTENHLWRSLFGLLFWDELLNDKRSLHSSFDKVPQILRDGRFYTMFSSEIETKLGAVRSAKGLKCILHSYAKYHDQPNGVFSWYAVDIDALSFLLQSKYCKAVATMLDKFCQNYLFMKDGYPDILLMKGEQLRFIEVKAPGDVIRRNQLTRLGQLQQSGFDCGIIRACYTFNPDQDYVVLDVETTGGMKPYHRVTEIGAVKVRNFEIIDQWQSLINPQRPIPANITKLTGISNAMVQDAPIFSDIVDDLSQFLEGAIFVAHNVNFDYGFIRQEYTRLSRSFRMPKMCSCTGMRRNYPGHNSYSLANLSRYYGIPLDTHHRALCDAKAAAGLLNLINKKRCA